MAPSVRDSTLNQYLPQTLLELCQTYRHRFFPMWYAPGTRSDCFATCRRGLSPFPENSYQGSSPHGSASGCGQVGRINHAWKRCSLVELTATRQEPQPGSARLAGRLRQGSQGLATQSTLHDKSLVDSFEAENFSNLPLQRDRVAAADTPFSPPLEPFAPGSRLPNVAALQTLRYGHFTTPSAQRPSAPFLNR